VTDPDAEMDGMTKQFVTAGLLETFTDDDGKPATRLTPDGEKVARQLALGADQDAPTRTSCSGSSRHPTRHAYPTRLRAA
jgi:hypothetical protein